jgi:hypothetical protein
MGSLSPTENPQALIGSCIYLNTATESRRLGIVGISQGTSMASLQLVGIHAIMVTTGVDHSWVQRPTGYTPYNPIHIWRG